FGKPVELSLGPSIFQDNVATLDVSQLPQPFSHSLDQRLGRRAGLQNAEAPYLRRWLLRTRRERPRPCAAGKRDELAAFHSITSSAHEHRADSSSILCIEPCVDNFLCLGNNRFFGTFLKRCRTFGQRR